MQGRKKMIQTPDELWSLFTEYVEWRDKNPIMKNDFKGKDADEVQYELQRPLTEEGFSVYVWNKLGMKYGIKHYIENTDNRYSDFVPVASRIKISIRNDQIEGGMVGIYNPSITARLNNLSENIKQNIEGNIIKIDLGAGTKPDKADE